MAPMRVGLATPLLVWLPVVICMAASAPGPTASRAASVKKPRLLSTAFEPLSAQQALIQLAEQTAGVEANDVYGQGHWLQEFELQLASDFGKEAAMFFITGVCAQLSALCVHAGGVGQSAADPLPRMMRPSFLVHATSHLLLHEEDAARKLLGFTPLIAGHHSHPLRAEDAEKDLKRLEAVGCRPACIVLEVPHRELGCESVDFDELVAFRVLADKYQVPLHVDGARLFEIQPFLGRPLKDIAALCDSLYISFYKGLGGMTGAALLGRADFVAAASPWRRRLGGNPFTSMPFALSCRAAYETHAGSFEARWHKLRTLAPQLSRTAASHGGSLRFVPAEPQCCQAHCYIRGSAEQLDAARDEVLAELDIKLYNKLRACGAGPGKDECYFEITVGPNNIEIPDDVFAHAWSCFFEALRKAESS